MLVNESFKIVEHMICIPRFYNEQRYFRALCHYRKTTATTQFSHVFRNLISVQILFPATLLNYLAKYINLLNITKQDTTFRAYKSISQFILVFIVVLCTFYSHNLVISGHLIFTLKTVLPKSA